MLKGQQVAANVSPFSVRPRRAGAGWLLGTYVGFDGTYHVVRVAGRKHQFAEGRVVEHDGTLAEFLTEV